MPPNMKDWKTYQVVLAVLGGLALAGFVLFSAHVFGEFIEFLLEIKK